MRQPMLTLYSLLLIAGMYTGSIYAQVENDNANRAPLKQNLQALFSRQFSPLIEEQQQLQRFQTAQCLITEAAKLGQIADDFPRLIELKVLIKAAKYEQAERFSRQDFYIIGDVKVTNRSVSVANTPYTQHITHHLARRFGRYPFMAKMDLRASVIAFEDSVCERKDVDGDIVDTIEGFQTVGAPFTINPMLLDPKDFQFLGTGNFSGFERQGTRVLLGNGKMEVNSLLYRRRPASVPPRDDMYSCPAGFYASADFEEHTLDDDKFVINSAAVEQETVTLAGVDYPLREGGAIALTIPFFNGGAVALPGFSAQLVTPAGSETIPLLLDRVKAGTGSFQYRVGSRNALSNGGTMSLLGSRGGGGNTPGSIVVGFEPREGLGQFFQLDLTPSNVDFDIEEASLGGDGRIQLYRNQKYTGRFSFKADSGSDFSDFSIPLKGSSDSDPIITTSLLTPSGDRIPHRIASLSPEAATFSSDGGGVWTALFTLELEKHALTITDLLVSKQMPIRFSVVGDSHPIQLLESRLESLRFEGRAGLQEDGVSDTVFELFFGRDFEVDKQRKTAPGRFARDGFTLMAFGDFADGSALEKEAFRHFSKHLPVTVNGDSVLGSQYLMTKGQQYFATGEAVGEAELTLSLNTKAMPADTLLNGQADVNATDTIKVQVNSVKIINGQRVEKFTVDELLEQRVELAGDLFAIGDINRDQLQLRQLQQPNMVFLSSGPIDMSQYQVEWVSGEASATTGFEQQGDSWASPSGLDEAAMAGLQHVILKNAEGLPVGEFSERGVNAIQKKPIGITLLMQDKPKAGEVIDLKGLIRNVAAADFQEALFCRWSINKANDIDVINAGIFENEETPVIFQSGLPFCTNKLVIHRVIQNVARSPNVTVQLIHNGGVVK